MICENCNKQKAIAYHNTKKVCEDCFYKLSQMKKKKKDHKCVVCSKIFRSMRNPSIPLCSRLCRDRFKSRIKREEDALNRSYEAFGIGGAF